jgi:hypothetical protein
LVDIQVACQLHPIRLIVHEQATNVNGLLLLANILFDKTLVEIQS